MNKINNINKKYAEYKKTRKVMDRKAIEPNKTKTTKRGLVIVPYRPDKLGERIIHLKKFINYFKTNLPDINILIVEQKSQTKKFNRGTLLNIGMKIGLKNYDYFITHDIDMLPKINNDFHMYYWTYPQLPLHMGYYNNKYNFWTFIGAVLSINKDDVKNTNGFPNNFWGWGGEDDALYNRLALFNDCLWIPKTKSNYIELEHEHQDKKETTNHNKKKNILEDYHKIRNNNLKDGISSVKFKLINKKKYTNKINHIIVDF